MSGRSAESIPPAHDLRLEGVRKTYGDVEAVRGLDIAVEAGTMVSLIGPSGCGKTTTLRMIAGLEALSGGRITSGGVLLSGDGRSVPPERRGMGMVFQTYALWPHMTVGENVSYGLKRKGLAHGEVADRAQGVLDLVNMAGFAARYPNQLSGGQQQRVALARAIASEPRILLFDEPLSNLDAVLREQMRFEIRALQQRLGITSVYVTHSQEEALALSDRIVVMAGGAVAQAGSPTEIYDCPRTAFVAGFIGLTNILSLHEARRDGRGIEGRLAGGETVRAGAGALGRTLSGPVPLSVRTTEIRLASPEDPPREGANRLSGVVRSSIFTGGLVDTFIALRSQPDTVLRVQSMPPPLKRPDDPVLLEFDPARTVILED